jgi:AbrB family looped-hinge helix DNA binding protein
MRTRVSTKGQVALPGAIRRRLGLQPGDTLDVSVKSGHIVLAPHGTRAVKASVRRDPITGLPVLSAGRGSQPLTSEQVQDILSGFP